MGILVEYMENVYICCVHYLVNRRIHGIERIFWLIVIFTSLGGTYFVLSRTIFDYGSQKPIYKVDTNYLDWNSPFPSIVLCEKKFSYAFPVTLKRNLDKYLQTIGIPKSAITFSYRLKMAEFAFARVSEMATLHDFCTSQPCPQGNLSVLMDLLRHKCDDLFSYCKYDDIVFNCCDEFLPISTYYGKCFAFNNFASRYNNSEHLKKLKWYIIRKPGRSQGQIYLEFKTSLILLYVLGQLDVPHPLNENSVFRKTHGSVLRPDYAYYYRVNMMETITLNDQLSAPVEARGCRFPHENYLEYFDMYSEAHCILECYMQYQKKTCGCILHPYPAPRFEHCEMSDMKCITETFKLISCDCLPDCNSTQIEIVGTTLLKDKHFMNNQTSISVTLDVPAPTLRYIRNTLKSGLTIIVALGGAVSFFLGVSFLTIAQTIYYFCIRSVTDFLARKKERKIREKEEKMDENFRIARMKLKLKNIETEMHNDVLQKMNELNHNKNK